MSKPLDEARFVENIHSLLDDTDGAGVQTKKVHFLVLYEEGQSPAMVPGGFTAYCEVGFCPVGELLDRVQAGFQGMVAIPADLLSRVDIGFLNATPALEVMIMPVPALGEHSSLAARRLIHGKSEETAMTGTGKSPSSMTRFISRAA
jgi:hypothetical protein